ncbi:MAG: hypothetical protein ACKOTF_05020, partial [Opitutaceae bacterium]
DYKAPWSFTRKETGQQVFTWIQRLGDWESRVAYMAERTERDDEEHRRPRLPLHQHGLRHQERSPPHRPARQRRPRHPRLHRRYDLAADHRGHPQVRRRGRAALDQPQ